VVGNVRFRLAMAGVALGALAWSGLRRLAGQPGETPAMEKLRTTRLLAITFSFYAQPRYRFHNAGCWRWPRRFGLRRARPVSGRRRLIDWEDYLCRVHMAGLNRYALKRKEARAAQPEAEAAAADAARHPCRSRKAPASTHSMGRAASGLARRPCFYFLSRLTGQLIRQPCVITPKNTLYLQI
jgi:hypothetical protein